MLRRMLISGLSLAALAAPLQALPDHPTVVQGGARINSQGGIMQIVQNTTNAIINWKGFSIAPGEMVQFVQSGANAAVLNRVTGTLPSNLMGSLKANGQVFLLNPNGVFIGPTGVVETAGFLASTLAMSDQDFLAKNYHLVQDPSQPQRSVVNQGTIHVSDGGLLVLVAPLVSNEGLIVAHVGQVNLAGTQEATIHFDGKGLVNFALPSASTLPTGNVALTPEATSSLLASLFPGNVPSGTVVQSGSIDVSGAQAGQVLLQSQHATALLPTSQILANGQVGGDVKLLSQGTAVLDGKVDASGVTQGGAVELSGKAFRLKGQVDVGASQGKVGSFLIDPDTITIVQGAGADLDYSLPQILASVPNGTNNQVSTAELAIQTGVITLQATGDVTVGDLGVNGVLSLQPGASLNLESQNGSVNFVDTTNALVTTGGSISILSGSSSNLGRLFALQGGNINIQAGGAVHYTTLVAQGHNGAGGSVVVTAAGDISPGTASGQGIAATSVSLTANSPVVAAVIPRTFSQGTTGYSNVDFNQGSSSSSSSRSSFVPSAVAAATTPQSSFVPSAVAVVTTPGHSSSSSPVRPTEPQVSAPTSSINVPVVAADVVTAQATGAINLGITPGTLDAGGHPSSVGTGGTLLTARAGGDINITSKNTLVLDAVQGNNVNLYSATGSLIGVFPTSTPNLTAEGAASLSAPQGFVGTPGNPVTVNINGPLSVDAGSQSGGVSGILLGRTQSGFIDTRTAPGEILFNPTNALVEPQSITMDNPYVANYMAGRLVSDEFLTAGAYVGLYSSMMQFFTDPDDWRKFLGKQVVWEDEGSEEQQQ